MDKKSPSDSQPEGQHQVSLGIAGGMAKALINSKLTPLIILASLLLGFFAVVKTPREEEPQIIVPMADVLVEMPGATAEDISQRVTAPMEQLIWEVPGVEYVYTTSSPGRSMAVVRFLVGQDQEKAFVRLRDKLSANLDRIPPGASQPIIKPRSIDDVPILSLTFHSDEVGFVGLRALAARVREEVKSVDNVSETTLIGGRRRELRVQIDPQKLAARGLAFDHVMQALAKSNLQGQSGLFNIDNKEIAVRTGELLRTKEEAENLVVSAGTGFSVRLADVATVTDGHEEPADYVFFAAGSHHPQGVTSSLQPAVTLTLAKRQGANAVDVVHKILDRVEKLKGTLIPSNVTVTVTRDYGESSAEKSGELLYHMGIAVVSVTLLIALALGFKESLVVLVAIPVTLALTLLMFYLYGYTLNRITLFALIFSIGILVDDAIVVVENIVRHFRMPENRTRNMVQVAVEAVGEVGNPTILATFAVIAAILPMAFVGGLMGPYMRPIPVGASAAMIFSMLVAFMITPWAAIRLLKKTFGTEGGHGHGEGEKEDFLTKLYRRIMNPMLEKGIVRWGFFALVAVLLFGSMALVPLGSVIVKMLPFDNKNEFQVIVDMPTGTTLEETASATKSFVDALRHEPEVADLQAYVGTAGPFNFNGLVRHYFMRAASYQADIQVNLTAKHHRKAQSHDIVRRIRPRMEELAKSLGARVKIAEVPPGPPVLQTLVAEVYGPTHEARLDLARKVKDVFSKTEGVSDIDWYVEDDQATLQFQPDQEKAAMAGVDVDSINRTLKIALSGGKAGLLHDAESREDVPITLRLSREDRSGEDRLASLGVPSRTGALVPLIDLVKPVSVTTDKSLYRKNLKPVIYVTGEVVGRRESPVYAILAMNKAMESVRTSDGSKVEILTTHLPEDSSKSSMKWDGEWHITYEVFRDLGIAFAGVLVIIYILVVAWFQDFKTPLVIMAPIPLTLAGILPGHAMMGAFFTATSMIGFIAGAGIIVRNSIILVDFIELRRSQGSSLQAAVVDAGAIRFRPMLLTAAAVIVGSFVILFDPIFQGLAVSLMAGEIASTLLSRFAVPVLYYMAKRKEEAARVALLS